MRALSHPSRGSGRGDGCCIPRYACTWCNRRTTAPLSGGGPGGVMSAFVAPAVRVPERVVGGKALNARRSLIIRGVSWALCTRVSV